MLQKKKQERKLLKNADAKNNKSKRKRIRAKMQNQFLDNLNKEHKEVLKLRIEGRKRSRGDAE